MQIQLYARRDDVILKGRRQLLFQERVQLAVEQLEGVLAFVSAHGKIKGQAQILPRQNERGLRLSGAASICAPIFAQRTEIERSWGGEDGYLPRRNGTVDNGVDDRSHSDCGGAGCDRDPESDRAPFPDVLTDRQERLEAWRAMCYVMQLFLRHLRLSPGNGVEDGGIGAADAVRVGKLP